MTGSDGNIERLIQLDLDNDDGDLSRLAEQLALLDRLPPLISSDATTSTALRITCLVLTASMRLREGKTAEADKLLQAVLTYQDAIQTPDDSGVALPTIRACQLRARLYEQLGNVQPALDCVTSGLAELTVADADAGRTASTRLQFELAAWRCHLLVRCGQLEAASAELGQPFTAADLSSLPPAGGERSWALRALLDRAYAFAAIGDWHRWLAEGEVLQQLLVAEPANSDASLNEARQQTALLLAHAYVALGRLTDAEKQARTAIALAPAEDHYAAHAARVDAQRVLGDVQRVRGRYREALDAYKAFFRHADAIGAVLGTDAFPMQRFEAHLGASACALQLGNLPSADQHCDLAIRALTQARPGTASGQQRDRVARALLHRSRLWELEGDLFAARSDLAEALRSLGASGSAADPIPLRLACLLRLGDLQQQTAEHRDAIRSYRRGLELAKNVPGMVAEQVVLCRLQLARCLAKIGAGRDARAELATARQAIERQEHLREPSRALLATLHLRWAETEVGQDGREQEVLLALNRAEAEIDLRLLGLIPYQDRVYAQIVARKASLLRVLPDPHPWAQHVGEQLNLLLELRPERAGNVYLDELALFLRRVYQRFIDDWLALALEQDDLDQVVRILGNVQGTRFARQHLDELAATLQAADTPSVVKELVASRQALRESQLAASERETARQAPDPSPVPDQQPPMGPNAMALLDRYRRARHAATTHGGFDVLATGGMISGLDELLCRLPADGALLLLIYRARMQGVLLIRPDAPAQWLPLRELWLSARLEQQIRSLLERNPHDRLVERDLADPSGSAAHLDQLWQALEQVVGTIWAELRSALQGIRTVNIVPFGAAHSLLLEAGAPEQLLIRRHPALVFFLRATDPGIGEMMIAGSVQRVFVTAFAGPRNDVPRTLGQPDLARRVWGATRVFVQAPDHARPEVDFDVDLAVFSSHGMVSDTRPDSAALLLGPARRLTMGTVLRGARRERLVLLLACLIGRTIEDAAGDPIGLVSGFLMRDTQQVIAGVLPISDRWALVFSVLVQQGLKRASYQPVLEIVAEAKRRFVEGDWYDDTSDILASALAGVEDTLIASYLANREFMPAMRSLTTRRDPVRAWRTTIGPQLHAQEVSFRGLLRIRRCFHAVGYDHQQATRAAAREIARGEQRLLRRRRPPRHLAKAFLFGMRVYG